MVHEIDQMIGIGFGPFSPTVFVARVAINLRRASCSADLLRNGGEYLQLVATITSPARLLDLRAEAMYSRQ